MEELCDILLVEAERKDSLSRRSATNLTIKLGDWIWRRGGRGEDLQLAYLLSRPSALQGPKKCLLEFRGWGYQVESRVKKVREVGLSDQQGGTAAVSLEMRLENWI